MNVDFETHISHAPLWKDTNWRYAIVMGGRGNGRSGSASRYAISQLLSKEYTRGTIMRATREDIKASSWQALNDRIIEQNIQDNVNITDTEMSYGVNSLRTFGFRASSGSLTARLKSLENFSFAWIEEAEEIGEDEFRTFDDTLRTTRGRIRIVLTLNTPPKNHWLLRKWFDLEPHPGVQGFFIPKLKEGVSNVIYIPGTWRENEPNLDKDTIERYKAYQWTNPSYYWQVIEGLSPEEVRGKIYSGWQLIDAIPSSARLVRFGVDWGWFPDPVSVVAVYYCDGGYILDEVIHGTNIDDAVVADAIKSVPGWEYTPAICGADEPKSIELLKKYRVLARSGVKGPGSVDYRIKATASKKVSVTRKSKHIWEGYENYHWAEDRDGNPKGEPDHAFSDTMDATSYGLADINPLVQLLPSSNGPQKARSNVAV